MDQDGSNSHEQFTRVWTQAQPMVASYLGGIVPEHRDLEDLLQSVAIACLRKFNDYDHKRPFAAWAIGIARLEALHWMRNKARGRLVFDDELLQQLADTAVEVAPELDHRSAALRECLRRIQGRTSELLHLRYEEGLKPGAIAAHLQMAVLAVRVALSRARAGLRECIERRLRAGEAQL